MQRWCFPRALPAGDRSFSGLRFRRPRLSHRGANAWRPNCVGGSRSACREANLAPLESKAIPGDGVAGKAFGSCVAISGAWATVGAPADAWNGADTGAAYLPGGLGSGWKTVGKLTARDRIRGLKAGTAYLFQRTEGSWVQDGQLLTGDGGGRDLLGSTIGASSCSVIIGAPGAATRGAGSGASYVYEWCVPTEPVFVPLSLAP